MQIYLNIPDRFRPCLLAIGIVFITTATLTFLTDFFDATSLAIRVPCAFTMGFWRTVAVLALELLAYPTDGVMKVWAFDVRWH